MTEGMAAKPYEEFSTSFGGPPTGVAAEVLRRKLVTPEELLAQAEAIRPQLKRYPAIKEESFLRCVKEFLGGAPDV